MSFKTILVHVDDFAACHARTEIAINLALAEEAHLIGAAMTGISRLIEEGAINFYAPSLAALDAARARAESVLDRFVEAVERAGVPSYERRLIDDELGNGMALQARYSDLAIVGQFDPEGPSVTGSDFPEYVAIGSGTPVLIVPHAGGFRQIGERILVAWNGSREARHAVQEALPLLQRARQVDLAVLGAAESPAVAGVSGLTGVRPEFDIMQYLLRHGIEATLATRSVPKAEVASALLSMAAGAGADLLVMGCYGRSRLREMLLGGVTREILASMTLPVLMSH